MARSKAQNIQNSSVWTATITMTVFTYLGCILANLYLDYYQGESEMAKALLPLRWIHSGLSSSNNTQTFYALLLFLLTLIAGCLVARYIMFSQRREKKIPWLHGTARFATTKEIEEGGFFPDADEPAIFLGQVETKRGPAFVRHAGPEHAIVFAPTRSGKGISIVIPTALSWQESLVCLDIKGELYTATAKWRADSANNIVHKLDLTDPSGKSSKYNPLSAIRIAEPQEAADIANLVQMLIDPHGRGLDDHWSRAALSWLQGVTTFILYEARTENRCATLAEVARALSSTTRPMEQLLEEMLRNTFAPDKTTHSRIALSAQDMLNRAPEERSGVHSTAVAHMSIYLEGMLALSLSESDFILQDLMQGARPMSLYIVIRPPDLERLIPVARLIINQIVRLNAERDPSEKHQYKHKLLLLLDEFPALGRLSIFEKALGYIAGYGIRALIITQDRSQLIAHYGKDETITANCNLRIAFAPNELSTAQWISESLGKQTIIKEAYQTSGKRASMSLGSVSSSISEVARPLMTPDEVMGLPGLKKNTQGQVVQGGDVLIMSSGIPAIRARQVPYFLEAGFSVRIAEPILT